MKQTTRILSVLLALLMAFSVTAIAAGGLTVTAKYGDADLEGATVPAGSDITLTFSNNVTEDNILASNLSKIKVLNANNGYAATTITVADKNTITVTLDSELAKGSYKLTLGKEITAKNGTTLGEKKEFSFTVKGSGTGGGGGNNPLSVKSVTVDGEPLEGKELESCAQILIRFDRGMTENAAENLLLIHVLNADGTEANINVIMNSDDTEDAKREYVVNVYDNESGPMTLVIGGGVKANNGNTLGEDYTVSFSFKGDETPTEPDVEPANPTFLDRVKAFFTDLFA